MSIPNQNFSHVQTVAVRHTFAVCNLFDPPFLVQNHVGFQVVDRGQALQITELELPSDKAACRLPFSA